jgi:hypothetical protein
MLACALVLDMCTWLKLTTRTKNSGSLAGMLIGRKRNRPLSADSVEKLRLNEWTSKLSLTMAATTLFCTNSHAQDNRKRLSWAIFTHRKILKF